ncbi:hypothetical protein BpHYR1_004399 [Brachionus plicatilis]|uniref:Uncharacterized protein n=1 Tax=Brachionus plicatilis TaxID=10195 RepID=A0A3M7PA49_BRAPC|nr:hypothetical protein BpHYR1_004399 [Brachionus plicatilis]
MTILFNKALNVFEILTPLFSLIVTLIFCLYFREPLLCKHVSSKLEQFNFGSYLHRTKLSSKYNF